MKALACIATTAAILVTAAALPASMVHAAPTNTAAKVGDCLYEADVEDDQVDFTSKVDCSSLHQAQVLAVRQLPASIARRPYAELSKRNSGAYKAWTQAGYRLCNAPSVAKGIWGSKGAQVVKALGPQTLIIEPHIGARIGIASVGWVLPDEASWKAGDRSLYCMVSRSQGVYLEDDIRDIATSAPAPASRWCGTIEGVATSCERPHDVESLFLWYAKGFPRKAVKDLTDADWAPWDRRCQSAADTLVGAARNDIVARANVDTEARNITWGPFKDVTVMYCEVLMAAEQPLPPGTVVGLGTEPIGLG